MQRKAPGVGVSQHFHGPLPVMPLYLPVPPAMRLIPSTAFPSQSVNMRSPSASPKAQYPLFIELFSEPKKVKTQTAGPLCRGPEPLSLKLIPTTLPCPTDRFSGASNTSGDDAVHRGAANTRTNQ